MNEFLIKKYVTFNNINEFAKKEGIILSNEEIIIIYNYILLNYKSISSNNHDFSDLKNKIDINTYNKIIELYNKYKKNLGN